ncbi:MAG: hypothetical protein LLG37_06255 [Spirochaetia bacterium]|nr:hypothetical protein [Spirochaetia bacterium]
MKKIILLALFVLLAPAVFALDLNIMTTSGELISGQLIGADDGAVYIKAKDGNAKTVKLPKIKKIFDADTMADVTAQYKSAEAKPAEAAKPAPAPKEPAYAEPSVTSSGNRTYQTVEEDSGTIDLRAGSSVFTRTIPKYIGMDFSFIRVNVLFSQENVPLREAMLQYFVSSPYDTFDPANTLSFSYSFDANLYLRPIDCLAIGGFAGITPIGQNYSVHTGNYKYLYVDMPTTQFGLLVKFIPYSVASRWGDGEAYENEALGFNFKFGAASLGTIFSNASINNENANGDNVDLFGSGPFWALELEYNVEMALKLTLGFQSALIQNISATGPYTGITDAEKYLSYGGRRLSFSAQGIYFMMAIGI